MKKAGLAILCVALIVSVFAIAQRPAPQLRLELVDHSGKRTELGTLPISTFAPRISPDGRHIAFDTEEGPAVWIADFPGVKSMRRLPSTAKYPTWSADGDRIFFIAVHNGQEALYGRKADGTGEAELLAEPARAPEHLLKRMQSITFITLKGDYDVWRYSMADKKATPLVELPRSSQHSSRVSPDERWIAYVSDETGQFEVYVQPIPTTGAKYQITKDGGEHPVWSPDGREIYFNRDATLFSVAVKTDSGVTAATPKQLPITGFIQGVGRRQFDITADGKQFLMLFH
jgi:Tol biopolymer transport system component